jgi:ABC-2 type transport system ATP-binding protein
MDDIAIKVEKLNKTFKLPHEKHTSVKSAFVNFYRKRTYETQKALNDVSFEIKKGEFFGIVGRNGSGKSTLLKLLAGIYAPTHGSTTVNGSLTPFIELGVGFNPELTGRENVYLNGALLGFNRKEMSSMYKDIVEFAELEKFMDQKLKNYSSGMQVRLAFSIAIRAQSEILLLDEVLAVGDTAFQKKCNDYFYKLKEEGHTVILVTHSMGDVEQFCDRAMLVDSGKVIKIGGPTEIADAYNEFNLRASAIDFKEQSKESNKSSDLSEIRMLQQGGITKVETYNPATKQKQNTFTYSEKIGVRYLIEAYNDLESPTVGLVFKDRLGNKVFATNTPSMNIELRDLKPRQKIHVEFEIDNIFANGNYLISGAVASRDRSEVYHKVNDTHTFEVGGWKLPESIAHPHHDINVIYK